VDGEINRRPGVDGQSYAVRFRLHLPSRGWNGRFYMGGGGTDERRRAGFGGGQRNKPGLFQYCVTQSPCLSLSEAIPV
jgi:hypothetical protein